MKFAFLQRLILGLLTAGLAILSSACQSPGQSAASPLNELSAVYRPIDRADTLGSYWAPDSVRADSLFAFTDQHLHRVVVRARLLTAAARQREQCDTLTFRPCGNAQGGEVQRGEVQRGEQYKWEFDHRLAPGIALDTTAHGVPTRVLAPLTSQLLLYEYVRRRPRGKMEGWYDYTMEYPFQPVSLAQASDSVVYVRAYPLRQNVRQPTAYYTYAYHPNGARDSVYVPHYADQVDSSRIATIRFSLHKLPALHLWQ